MNINLWNVILSNKQTSPTLKKLIEENKEENLRKALHPGGHKLEISDLVIIRNCIKELFDKRREIREEMRKKRNKNKVSLKIMIFKKIFNKQYIND